MMQVDLLGDGASNRARTSTLTSVGGVITWDEEFRFDVCSEEEELRFHLCDSKKKKTSSKTRVAAAGIYVKDILGYVPVKKRFDMYDPKGGKIVGELGLCFSLDEAEAQLETEGVPSSPVLQKRKGKPQPVFLKFPIFVVLVTVSVALVASSLRNRDKKSKHRKA